MASTVIPNLWNSFGDTKICLWLGYCNTSSFITLQIEKQTERMYNTEALYSFIRETGRKMLSQDI